jgi:hypothetical protein
MTTTTAITPRIKNVLSIAKIPPMAMKASQMARIAPTIVHIIRPMSPVCPRPLTIFPSAVLAAAVLAAEQVPFLLVGSAALWLRSEITTVADADAVIEPGEHNIHRLREALAGIAIGPVPSMSSFLGGSVIPVMTAYGKVDCLLERGRQDWRRLRRGASFLSIADVPVLVAASADAWDLRRRYKECEDE